jgi:hypothetical protein
MSVSSWREGRPQKRPQTCHIYSRLGANAYQMTRINLHAQTEGFLTY